jgi:hypothetical protein
MIRFKKKEKQTWGILCQTLNKTNFAIRKGRRRKLGKRSKHLNISLNITSINFCEVSYCPNNL